MSTFKNYPKSYWILFCVKALGNFTFYGLRSILVLYLLTTHRFSDQSALTLYGTFMALAYLTPLIGGWVADRWLGIKQTVFHSAWITLLGCLLITFLPNQGLFLGLALISLGTGFFKPTSLSAVGYVMSNDQKDSAYTTLYLGINIAAFLGPLACGFLGTLYGWSVIFPLIGITALVNAFFFQYALKDHTIHASRHKSILTNPLFAFMLIPLTALLYFILHSSSQITWLTSMILIMAVTSLVYVYLRARQEERKQVQYLAGLMVFFAWFCALFEQSGGSMTLFIDRFIDKNLTKTFALSTPAFQSLTPFFVIFVLPALARLWIILDKGHRPFSEFSKFSVGFLFISVSFALLAFTTTRASDGLLSPWWLIFVFFIQVIGEACIIPIGFSAVSKLAPKGFESFLMGLWMVAISGGHYMAVSLAYIALSPPGAITTDHAITLNILPYRDFFLMLAGMSLLASALLFIINRVFLKHTGNA